MKITASNVIRCAGLSAVVAGLIFTVVGLIHPAQIVASVTTARWTFVHLLTIVMAFFGLLGIAGIYARQVDKAGWMGLAGYVLLSPRFAEGFLGSFSGAVGETRVGLLATLWSLLGVVYILGNILFGIATFRAGILSRWAAALLGLGAVSSPAFALLPQSFAPLAAVPVGFGLAWLGYSLWSERRE